MWACCGSRWVPPDCCFSPLHLFVLRGPVWGLAWAVKVLSDPFHNIAIYWHLPLALLRSERLDPIEPHASVTHI